jgi:ABC-type transport system substrate-binding protein
MLAATGAAGIGAALLAACGGDSDSGNGGDASGLVTKFEDSSKQAKRGGIYKTHITADPAGWDPHFRGSWFGTLGAVLYSRLAIVKPGMGENSSGEVGGDLAEGWEFSGDGLTATFRLRQNAKWAPTAPVNGRNVDVQDVVASWERWKATSAVRSSLDNSASPDAPIMSMAATDSRTITMKLAFPAVTLPAQMSASVGQSYHILPKEAGSGYDPLKVSIGSGPYYVTDHQPSAYVHVKRNPGYYDTERPYMDAMEYPLLTEYATGLAAFKNGQIYTYPVKPEEMLGTKRDLPDLAMYTADISIPSAHVFFGYRNNDKAMFRDKRLRQAYSMSLDRDLFAEIWYNVPDFTSAGLPVEIAWSSAVPATEYTGWVMDPRDKDFGPNAKYYQHDIAEAKKLLSAAGFANGVEYVATRAGGQYGPEYDRQIEVMEAMAADAGFKPTANVINYNNELVPRYQNVQGDFEGILWSLRPQSASDPIDKLAEWMFSTAGNNFLGFDPEGTGSRKGDPIVDDLIRKSKVEQDSNKRKQIMVDLQKHLGERMYVIRSPSGASGFQLAWPVVRSFGYFQGDPRDTANRSFYTWLDPTRKPLGQG